MTKNKQDWKEKIRPDCIKIFHNELIDDDETIDMQAFLDNMNKGIDMAISKTEDAIVNGNTIFLKGMLNKARQEERKEFADWLLELSTNVFFESKFALADRINKKIEELRK